MPSNHCCKHIDVALDGEYHEVDVGFDRMSSSYEDCVKLNLINSLSNEVNFSVKRDHLSPLLDEAVFQLHPREGVVLNSCHSVVSVSFHPRFASEESIDYYDIFYGTNFQKIRINLTGRSEPCEINVHPQVLIFDNEECARYCGTNNDDKSCLQQCFLIENNSPVPARVSFSLAPGIFRVEPQCCCVDPNSKQRIVVICLVLQGRSLCQALHAVLHNGSACCVQLLVGPMATPLVPPPLFIRRPARIWADLLLLDVDVVDFGRTSAASGSVRLVHATNVTSMSLNIEWITNISQFVLVHPRSCVICSGKTIAFEISLIPNTSEFLYYLHIEALVCAASSSADSLSTLHQLPIIGHTFAVDELTLAPKAHISPSPLVLPACATGDACYTTCILENRSSGHPLVFNVSDSACYQVFPLSNYIAPGEFTVIVVDYKAGEHHEVRVAASIKFTLNSLQLHTIELPVMASQENPKISWEPSFLKFPMVCRGMIAEATVNIRNLTRSRMRLFAESSEPYIHPENNQATLLPNMKLAITWKSSPEETGLHEYVISHRIHLVSATNVLNDVREEVVKTAARTCIIDGGISAEPRDLVLGIYPVGEKVVSPVRLSNHCDVTAHILLMFVPHPRLNESFAAVGLSSSQNVDRTSPYHRVALPAHKSVTINLTVVPDIEGLLFFQLVYSILRDQISEQRTLPLSLSEISIQSYRPYVQVADIEVKQREVFQDKLQMWRMLSIDRLNSKLREQNSLGQVSMTLPPRPCGSSDFSIVLLLENPGSVHAVWTFRFDCDHDWLHQSTTSGCLRPSASEPILLTVHLPKVPQVDVVRGEFRVNGGSNVVINFRRSIVPTDRGWVYLSTENLPTPPPSQVKISETIEQHFSQPAIIEMCPVEVGCHQPPLQYLTLFNAGLRPTEFHVHPEELRSVLTYNWNVPVIQCLDSDGVVPAGGCVRIRLLFRPIEERNYEFNLPLCVKSPCYCSSLILKATGVSGLAQTTDGGFKVRSEQLVFFPEENLSISHRYINLGTVSTLTTSSKIIFIRNHCKDYFCFAWSLRLSSDECCTVYCGEGDQQLNAGSGPRVEIEPKEGLIASEETIPITVTFASGEIPQICSHTIKVAFRNLTRERLFQINYDGWKRSCERRRAEFTITESNRIGRTRSLLPPPQEPMPTYIPVTVEAQVRHVDDFLPESASCQCRQLVLSSESKGTQASYDDLASLCWKEYSTLDMGMRAILWSTLNECELWKRIELVKKDCVPYYEQLVSADNCVAKEVENDESMSSAIVEKLTVSEKVMRDMITRVVRQYAVDNDGH